MSSTAWLGRADLPDLLGTGDLVAAGRLAAASNTTLLCRVDGVDDLLCVYKPTRGERPLWDFPEWTLTRRELAAHELSVASGWDLVPPTVWREDGPAGPGMCQLWIDADEDVSMVDVVRPGRAPSGWLTVLEATDGAGRPVELVHADTEDLQRMALFDALANNADRKGGHILTDANGRTWAIDHGVTFAVEPKLRTVLWGWAGEPIPAPALAELATLASVLGTSFDPVDRWLDEDERALLRRRLRQLIDRGAFPHPPDSWPAIPWPVF